MLNHMWESPPIEHTHTDSCCEAWCTVMMASSKEVPVLMRC